MMDGDVRIQGVVAADIGGTVATHLLQMYPFLRHIVHRVSSAP